MISINNIIKLAVLMAASLGGAAAIHPGPAPGATLAARNSGSMTYYSPGLGACGENNSESDPVAGVSSSVYGGGSAFKKVATIHYDGKSTTAKIVDLCPGCAAGDIDVSPAVFEKLSPLSAGRVDVTWELN